MRLVVLLTVAAVTGWYVWTRQLENRGEIDSLPQAHRTTDKEPRLQGPSDVARAAQVATPDAEESSASVAAGRFTLSLSVISEAGVEGEAQVHVLGLSPALHGETPSEVLGAVTVGETVEIDVGSLLAADPTVDHLQVEVDHPTCFPGSGRVPLPTGYVATDHPAPLELEVNLEQAAVIHGVVVDEDGQGVEGAFLQTARGTRRHPVSRPYRRTDAEGRYRMRCREGRFIVMAWHEARRPASSEVEALTCQTTLVPPLVLRKGVRIAGVVRLNGKLVRGATVIVSRQPLHHDATPVEEPVLSGGAAAWSGRVVRCQEHGRFEFQGLASRRWHLRVDGVPGGMLHPSVCRRTMRAVDAPDAAVHVDMEAARLHIRLEGPEDIPSAIRARVRVGDDTRGRLVSRGDEAVAYVTPRSRVEITPFVAKHWKADVVEVIAPGADEDLEVTLLLEPAPQQGATVTVRFGEAGDVSLERAFVGFYRMSRSFPEKRWEQRPTENTATIRHVSPGVYRLRAKPGAYATGIDKWYLTFEKTIELAEGDDVTVDVPLEEGGRVRLRVHDSKGAALPANWRLTDGRGTEVADWAFAVTPSGNGAGGRKGGMPDHQPGVLDPPVPPGRYFLEVSLDGFAPERCEVEVRARAYADVDITLWHSR